MRTLKNYEKKSRGTAEFPCKLYRVDKEHTDFIMPFHWHSECEIIYVHSGRLELTVDDHIYSVCSGDVVFISDGMLHGGTPAENDCIYDCIVFSGELIGKNTSHKEIRAILRHDKTVKTLMPSVEYGRISESVCRLCEFMTDASGDADSIISTGILLEVFGEIIKNGASEGGNPTSNRHILRLKNVITFIDEHYSEKITLEEISQIAGVSPKYLCRSFQSLTGRTPIAYLNEYRIECACEMLRNTEESMLDIAVACGFNDQSYFVKQFRRILGTTPGAYRRGNIKKEV